MKKNVVSENFLERKPMHARHLSWSTDNDGNVALEIENKGVFNKIAQKLLKKPTVSYVHLDAMGSFIWPLIDGDKSIVEIGKLVEDKFGKEAHPLYQRLAKFFQILESYNFITWNKCE